MAPNCGILIHQASENVVPYIYINWNKAIRRILCLPTRTHTWMLGPLSDQLHISTQLYIRSVKFIVCLLQSKNEIVHCIMNNAVSNAMSPLGNTIALVRYNYNHDIINDILQTINARIIYFIGRDVTNEFHVDKAKTILLKFHSKWHM